MVTFTVDGKEVVAKPGTNMMEAVKQVGVEIPYYCYHPGISIDGSCRVCIVKIEKMAKLQTSCSTTCAEGMVVSTNAPDVEAARAVLRRTGMRERMLRLRLDGLRARRAFLTTSQ